MCAHAAFKAYADIRPREGFGYDVKMFAQCVACGTPLKFEKAAGVQVEQGGLVAGIVAVAAGD